MRKSYFIAFLATIIRYYDYALFGLSASTISNNFMPNISKTDQLFGFFVIFSISVAARPLGSIIFGRISDKVGRIVSVKLTTIIAAISAILIAFLPSYNIIGITATILLTIIRMIFIMSLAGEVDSIKIYVSEKIGTKNRHFGNGLISFFAQNGVLLAAFMYHFTCSFTEIAWLWRVNFIFGAVAGLVIFILRNNLIESNYYLKHQPKYMQNARVDVVAQEAINQEDLIKIIAKNKLKFCLAVILSGVIGASYNFWLIFLSTFIGNAVNLITSFEASRNNIILITVYALFSLISGILADRKKLIYKQIFAALTLSIIVLLMIQYLSYVQKFSFFLHIVAVSLIPVYMIPIQVKLQSIFPTEVRVRMCSLSHSVGSMLFSSTIAFICIFLWKKTHFLPIIHVYFMSLLLLMIGALVILKKKSYSNMFLDEN